MQFLDCTLELKLVIKTDNRKKYANILKKAFNLNLILN